MDSKQLERLETDLNSRKAELESRLERTHKHIYHKDAPVSANFNEQIKETENDQLVMALEEEAIDELKQISRALQRIADEEYQECAKCGNDIGAERLVAIPYTDRCIRCAE